MATAICKHRPYGCPIKELESLIWMGFFFSSHFFKSILPERNYNEWIECSNWLDGPYWSLEEEVMEEDTSSKKEKHKVQMATVLFFEFPPFWTYDPRCHKFFMMILLTRDRSNPQVCSLNGTKAEKSSWIKMMGLSDRPWRALTWLLLNQRKSLFQFDLQPWNVQSSTTKKCIISKTVLTYLLSKEIVHRKTKILGSFNPIWLTFFCGTKTLFWKMLQLFFYFFLMQWKSLGSKTTLDPTDFHCMD